VPAYVIDFVKVGMKVCNLTRIYDGPRERHTVSLFEHTGLLFIKVAYETYESSELFYKLLILLRALQTMMNLGLLGLAHTCNF
jgi:hypothetical protein